jgi:hypothetical protein
VVGCLTDWQQETRSPFFFRNVTPGLIPHDRFDITANRSKIMLFAILTDSV